jgi:hypothetical protein
MADCQMSERDALVHKAAKCDMCEDVVDPHGLVFFGTCLRFAFGRPAL